jgi:hypothetical protein
MTAINIIWLLILDIFPTFIRGTAIGIGFFFFGFSGTLGYILAKLIEVILKIHQSFKILNNIYFRKLKSLIII